MVAPMTAGTIARLKSAAAGEARAAVVEKDDLRALLASHAALVVSIEMGLAVLADEYEAYAPTEPETIALTEMSCALQQARNLT